jgi:hypothetical protein
MRGSSHQRGFEDRDEVGVGVADIRGGHRTDVGAGLQLLGTVSVCAASKRTRLFDGGVSASMPVWCRSAAACWSSSRCRRPASAPPKMSALSASSSVTILFDE